MDKLDDCGEGDEFVYLVIVKDPEVGDVDHLISMDRDRAIAEAQRERSGHGDEFADTVVNVYRVPFDRSTFSCAEHVASSNSRTVDLYREKPGFVTLLPLTVVEREW